jgi:hypothetical protein
MKLERDSIPTALVIAVALLVFAIFAAAQVLFMSRALK